MEKKLSELGINKREFEKRVEMFDYITDVMEGISIDRREGTIYFDDKNKYPLQVWTKRINGKVVLYMIAEYIGSTRSIENGKTVLRPQYNFYK